MKDFYDILKIPATSDSAEIKKAYRLLALKYHPDKNPNNIESESTFLAIQEAYETLSDPILRKAYDIKCKNKKSASNTNKTETQSRSDHQITPLSILFNLQEIRKSVEKISSEKINKEILYNSLDTLLLHCELNLFVFNSNIKTTEEIVDEILICCKILEPEQVANIIDRLTLFSKTNKKIETKLSSFKRKYRILRLFDRFRTAAVISGMIIIVAIVYNLQTDKNYKNQSSSNANKLSSLSKGNDSGVKLTNEQLFRKTKDSLIASGWKYDKISNGQLPSCYNVKPKKGNVSNYLEVNVGGGTDVVIKVMNQKTEKCIRNVFINSRSTYTIENIPEGEYYLKIAYGKEWFTTIKDRQCIGMFLRNPMYERGQEIMNFNRQKTADGIITPSFKLSLDVISSDISNSFISKNISESEFNL
ncbi:MAG TPA: J domain-containing protein [Bacteroidia bacterium]|jgi:hypothetical protein